MKCLPLTEEEEVIQHDLYMATLSLCDHPVDVGALLYCPIHRRPLIECHDSIHWPALQRKRALAGYSGHLVLDDPDKKP